MPSRASRRIALGVCLTLGLQILSVAPLPDQVPLSPDPVAASHAADNFDDNAINTALWVGTTSGSGPSYAETNQQLEITIPATSSGTIFAAGYASRCKLQGDFDIQVDFTLLTWPNASGVRVGLNTEWAASTRWQMERTSFGTSSDFPGQPRQVYLVDDEGSVPPAGITATSDASGKLRLTRTGSTYAGYRFSGGAWVLQHSGTGTAAAVTFSLRAWGHNSSFTDQLVTLAFDNFTIVSGTQSCPLLPEQLYGQCGTGHLNCPVNFENEPVNTALGNYVTSATDLALPGRGVAFAFTRTYNSLDTGAGALGMGWRHSYEARLLPDPDGSAWFVAEDGARLLFTPDGSGGFIPPSGALSRLAPIGGGYELTRRDQIRYRFDAAGLLTAILDRNSNQVGFTYTAGQLTRITDTVGRSVDLTYNPEGRLAGLSGPLSLSVTYGYDPTGRLASVTDVRGKVTSYTYDPSGRLATIVDPNNHSAVTNEFGADGRISAQTDARGKRGTFAWNAATQTSTFTDARGGAWVDVYASNVLQRSIDPLGNTTRYTYDANFNVTSITDPRNFVTTLTYDAAGNRLTRTAPAPLSYVETWTYTARNDVETYRDGRNNTTTYGYDAAGNLTTVTAPLTAVTQFGRDPAGTGLLVSTTDPRGKTTTYGYDAQANLTSTTTPLGNVTTMAYDAAGRMLTTVEPRGNVVGADPLQYTTTFTYDAAGNALTASDPLSNVTSQTYDDVGNLMTITDANQHTTTYGYDAANHLTSVAHPAAGTTSYTYDNVGNLATRTDANQHTTTYAYDLAKRLTSVTDPLNSVWILTYDPAGNLATRRDANLKTTNYAYDALNRPTSITYADTSTPTTTFGYDANSNRTAMTDGAGTESYTFDALNRVTAVTRGSDTFGYGYDPADNVTSRTYPGQAAQTWAYDDDGRLTSANGAGYTYDPAANLLTAATPDGLTARYTYDHAGRLLEVAHTTASATLSRFSYALDPAGNRTAMTTREGTVTYRYDTLDRLTEACWSQSSCPGGAPATPVPCLACIGGLVSRPAASTNPPAGETYRTYTYDPVGNRLTEASNAGTTIYAYDAADRLTTVTPPGPSAMSYGFDANGNQTTAGATTYTYDLADRLKTATVGATTETYTYAGDGTRLSASTGPQANKTTKFLWDRAFGLPQLALERNGSDSLLRSYAYGLDLLKQQAGTKTYWYHHDGLGSVVDVTGNTGASLSWSEFYPYGLVRQQENAPGGNGAPAVQPFNFTGEQMDAVTGLYHLRARQYDPGTGRFLTTDPMAALMSDPYVASYAYVGNNPVANIDPSGAAAEEASSDWIIEFAKGGKKRIRDTGLQDLPDEEIQRRARDPNLTPQERRRYQTEEKARNLRRHNIVPDGGIDILGPLTVVGGAVVTIWWAAKVLAPACGPLAPVCLVGL